MRRHKELKGAKRHSGKRSHSARAAIDPMPQLPEDQSSVRRDTMEGPQGKRSTSESAPPDADDNDYSSLTEIVTTAFSSSTDALAAMPSPPVQAVQAMDVDSGSRATTSAPLVESIDEYVLFPSGARVRGESLTGFESMLVLTDQSCSGRVWLCRPISFKKCLPK